jgi:hypothetical protein
MPSISRYQSILAISRQMLAAGMSQDWDLLVDLEKQRQQLLSKTDGMPATQSDASLILEIQQCDSQLREKVEAWMSHVSIFLKSSKP